MKLNPTKLQAAMTEAGVSDEQLVSAIKPDASEKQSKELASAVRNWLGGRDHPRCRASDITAMAEACGVRPSDIARFTSEARFVRSSPQKSRLVTDMIQGMEVGQALDMLEFSPRRAAVFVRKVLHAAVSDAEALGARIDSLRITESRADEGIIIKRFQPKDRGRAHPIQKKTSHITVSVEEAN